VNTTIAENIRMISSAKPIRLRTINSLWGNDDLRLHVHASLCLA
jgi:hypothetical protein